MSGDNYNKDSVDAVLARMETKLDNALNALSDQNRRVTVLEIAENKRTGALVTLGVLCSLVGSGLTLVVDYFKGK